MNQTLTLFAQKFRNRLDTDLINRNQIGFCKFFNKFRIEEIPPYKKGREKLFCFNFFGKSIGNWKKDLTLYNE